MNFVRSSTIFVSLHWMRASRKSSKPSATRCSPWERGGGGRGRGEGEGGEGRDGHIRCTKSFSKITLEKSNDFDDVFEPLKCHIK